MSSQAAARDAERMRDRDAARGALNWYRAMFLSSPRALRAKITVPTLYLWSDRDAAIGPQGAALTHVSSRAPTRLKYSKGSATGSQKKLRNNSTHS